LETCPTNGEEISMSLCSPLSWRRLLAFAIPLGLAWTLSGCGDSSGAVPVAGKVFVDGEPLRAKIGTINLVPNKEKGNTTTFEPSGVLDEDGNFTVYYAKGKKGAPPGWYKVQIVASQLGEGSPIPTPRPKDKGVGPPPPKPLFHSKFMRTDTSGLEIEVVKDPAPGAYDLKLTK
jgi:hypothetical protein